MLSKWLAVWLAVVRCLQLNMTIMNQNERLEVPLLNYFNYSLEWPDFRVDPERCEPNDVASFFELPILPQLQSITALKMTSKSNVSLETKLVVRTLTFSTQPIKLYLVERGLLFLAKFDDKMDGSQSNQMHHTNLSSFLTKVVNCTDFAVDPVQYMLFVECYDTSNNNYNVKVKLERDANGIIESMTVNGSRSTTAKNTLKCRERKVIYLDSMQIASQFVMDSVLVYCPYSKRIGDNAIKALAFSSNLTVQNYQSINVSSTNKTLTCLQES